LKTSRIVGLVIVFGAVAAGGWYYRDHAAKPAGNAGVSAKADRAPTSVVTAAATSVDFPVRLHSIGNVEPIQVVAVKSRVQSELLEKHFTEGQTVKKGQLLFTLDDRELAAQVAKDEAAVARDNATLVSNKADYARAQTLLAKNAGTQQALDVATANVATTNANIKADQAALDTDKLRLSYARISSPIQGRVGAVTITPGNLVNASDTGPGLVTITQMKPVRITFTLPERDLPEVQEAMKNAKNPPVVKAMPRGGGASSEATGKLVFIDSSINQASGTVTLKAEFGNDDMGLWPGEFHDVELDLGAHANAVSVPTVAVQEGQGGAYVYVIAANSTAEMRKIDTGLVDGDRTEIIKGLKAGDKVVIDGQLRLAIGAPLREVAPGEASAATKS
jgi:multidrug efflux system membrane fusion protein